jgi:hypothetical protein
LYTTHSHDIIQYTLPNLVNLEALAFPNTVTPDSPTAQQAAMLPSEPAANFLFQGGLDDDPRSQWL